MILCNGYTFNKERQSARSSHWKCSLSKRYKCKARAIISNKNGVEIVKLSNPIHNHTIKEDTSKH